HVEEGLERQQCQAQQPDGAAQQPEEPARCPAGTGEGGCAGDGPMLEVRPDSEAERGDDGEADGDRVHDSESAATVVLPASPRRVNSGGYLWGIGAETPVGTCGGSRRPPGWSTLESWTLHGMQWTRAAQRPRPRSATIGRSASPSWMTRRWCGRASAPCSTRRRT